MQALHSSLRPILFVIFFLSSAAAFALDAVQAEVGKETAWTGQAVPIVITLFSPGPFSGTAAFDIPELPQTIVVKAGTPLVGSQEIDGESYLTQRHEFTLYTQRSGEIVIPAFRVRFAGKKTFTSDAVPMDGMTSQLQFKSKRPPGTDTMGVVISATEMKIEQSWNPLPENPIEAGDVILRTITRNVEGTTAMLLSPVPDTAPEGVQVYSEAPVVQDTVQRGDANALRVDIIKYQFQSSGHFTLPELTFTWWDPEQEMLESESLSSLEIDVAEAKVAMQRVDQEQTGRLGLWISAAIGLLVSAVIAWSVRTPIALLLAAWRTHHNRPEAVAARRLRAACTANDAPAAYTALMAWLAACRRGDDGSRGETLCSLDQQRPLREQSQALSRDLFSSQPNTNEWDGRKLWAAFSQVQRLRASTAHARQRSALPALNPSSAEIHDRAARS